MFPLKFRFGLAVVLAALVSVLFVLHGCQEPEVSEPSAAVAAAATDVPLTITGTGSGIGAVTSSPAGINCTITAGRTSTTGCSRTMST